MTARERTKVRGVDFDAREVPAWAHPRPIAINSGQNVVCGQAANPSPAHALQMRIDKAFTAIEDEVGIGAGIHRWPVAATLALVMGSCGVFWASVGFAIVHFMS